MFTYSIPLFKLFGFQVKVDWSWLIIFVLVTWSLAGSGFPMFYEDLAESTYLWMGLTGALGLFLSIILHEFGHALAARNYGVEMRGITLFIFGGVAEMKDEPPSAKAEFVIAVAGPIVSMIIGVTCLAAGYGARFAGIPTGVYGVFQYLGWINLILVVFNAVPAFPLDGGRVLRAILWGYKGSLQWATRVTSVIGSGFGIALIVWGVVNFISGLFIPGMWYFLLGLFLRGAAQMSYQQLMIRRALEGETVERFMHSPAITVPPSATVQEFVEDYVYKHHHKMFPVAENGKLQGCVTTKALKDVPRPEWATRRISDVAKACNEENTIEADVDATNALSKMTSSGNSRLIVVDNGELRGIVALKDIMKLISLKMELEEGK